MSIKNFKSLRDVRVKLERFTVFVGANASGKSSILQAIDAFCRNLPQRRSNEIIEDPEVMLALSRGSEGPVELAADTDGNCLKYSSSYTDFVGDNDGKSLWG